MRETTSLENQIIADQQYKYAADPTQKIQTPMPKPGSSSSEFFKSSEFDRGTGQNNYCISEALLKGKNFFLIQKRPNQ